MELGQILVLEWGQVWVLEQVLELGQEQVLEKVLEWVLELGQV